MKGRKSLSDVPLAEVNECGDILKNIKSFIAKHDFNIKVVPRLQKTIKGKVVSRSLYDAYNKLQEEFLWNPVEALAHFRAQINHALVNNAHSGRSEETNQAYKELLVIVDAARLKNDQQKEEFEEAFKHKKEELINEWKVQNPKLSSQLEITTKIFNHFQQLDELLQKISDDEHRTTAIEALFILSVVNDLNTLERMSRFFKFHVNTAFFSKDNLDNQNLRQEILELFDEYVSLRKKSLNFINTYNKQMAALIFTGVLDVTAGHYLDHLGAGGHARHALKGLDKSVVLEAEGISKDVLIKSAKHKSDLESKKSLKISTASSKYLAFKQGAYNILKSQGNLTRGNILAKSMLATNIIMGFVFPPGLAVTAPLFLGLSLSNKFYDYSAEYKKIKNKKYDESAVTDEFEEFVFTVFDSLRIEIKNEHGQVVGYRKPQDKDLRDIIKKNGYSFEEFQKWKNSKKEAKFQTMDPGSIELNDFSGRRSKSESEASVPSSSSSSSQSPKEPPKHRSPATDPVVSDLYRESPTPTMFHKPRPSSGQEGTDSDKRKKKKKSRPGSPKL